MGLAACLEVISGWKSDAACVCFLRGEEEDLCHQRVVPQGEKQQCRKGKGLWVILSPGIRGVSAVDNELGIVCLFAGGVRTHTFVPVFWSSLCLLLLIFGGEATEFYKHLPGMQNFCFVRVWCCQPQILVLKRSIISDFTAIAALLFGASPQQNRLFFLSPPF